MKSNKGITLTSLVVYVVGMTIIFAIIANITIYFRQNIRTIENTSDNSVQFTRLNEYLVNDIKEDVKIIIEEDNKLILNESNGDIIIYTILEDGIYRNKVKICNNIEEATFTKDIIYDKTKLKVYIKIGEKETFEKTMEYTIKN